MEIVGILFKFYVKNVKNWVFLNIIFIKKVEYYLNFMSKSVKNWVILNIIFLFL